MGAALNLNYYRFFCHRRESTLNCLNRQRAYEISPAICHLLGFYLGVHGMSGKSADLAFPMRRRICSQSVPLSLLRCQIVIYADCNYSAIIRALGCESPVSQASERNRALCCRLSVPHRGIQGVQGEREAPLDFLLSGWRRCWMLMMARCPSA